MKKMNDLTVELAALKFFFRTVDEHLCLDSVVMTGTLRDIEIMKETEAMEGFERWWGDEDRIEKMLPPEPYESWSDYFNGKR